MGIWLKLAVGWWQDPVLRAVAHEHGATAFAYWPIILSMAKDASSPDNPDGVFKTTRAALADAACDHPQTLTAASLDHVGALLSAMEDGALVALDGKLSSAFTITVTNFQRYNAPKGTARDRKQQYDERQKLAGPNSPNSSNSLNTPLEGSPPDETAFAGVLPQNVTVSERSGTIELEREKGIQEYSSGVSSRNSSPSKAQTTQIIGRIYHHWLDATGRNPNRNKLTKERRQKIKARIADGFTEQEICAAVTHWSLDPFHRGENQHGKTYDDLTTYLRTETKVAQALEAGAATADKAGSTERYQRMLACKNCDGTSYVENGDGMIPCPACKGAQQ